MKKGLVLLITILSFALATNLWASTITGSISGPSNGLFGVNQWSTATFEWAITDPDQSVSGHWEYVYSFTAPSKAISHIIIQVSDNFEEDDMLAGTTLGGLLDTYSEDSQGGSNPFMPEEMTGIKWNFSDVLSATITIVTDRIPMEGNFYAIDGKKPGEEVYAWSGDSTGFGFNVPVPDTGTNGKVPEPTTIFLLGSGLVGAVPFIRRKVKK